MILIHDIVLKTPETTSNVLYEETLNLGHIAIIPEIPI